MNWIKTLEELKNELFKAVYNAYNDYQELRREYGEYDVCTKFANTRYCTLYDLIANDFDLEDEYLEFRKQMEKEK